MAAPNVGLWYDLRNPDRWHQPAGRLYRDTLEQAVWAESLGFGSAWFSEHHLADDGFLSSPLTFAAAVGARTREMRVGTNVVVAGLHDPVRLAEDAATIALMTGDRFDLGVGMGYHELEFEAFGRRIKQRPSLLEDAVEVVRRAWRPDAEPYEGKRFSSPPHPVAPLPETPPRVLLGAQSPVGIQRAARLADGLITLTDEHIELYLEALTEHGHDPAAGRVYASQWIVVAEDPEKAWADGLGERALYQLNRYVEWGSVGGAWAGGFADPQAVLDAGAYRLMDASAAVEHLVGMARAHPQVVDVHFWAQLPGEPVESGSERVQYIADHVIPELTRRLG